MATTVQISEEVRKRLEELKVHKREALNDVIARLTEKATVKIKSNDLQKLKEIAMPILNMYGVKKAAVFGSFARGDATESSDVDLLVNYSEHTSLFDVVRLKRSLESALGRNVDLVSYEWIDEHLKDRIMKERVPLYE